METMKVKPWSEDQGDYVVINKADFDQDIHEAFDEKAANAPAKTPAEVLAMATDTGVHFKTFQAEARKVLGENAPSTKDDIIAALTALQA